MSDKLTELYNRVKADREEHLPDIATKAELERLIEDRRNDPPVPEHNYPSPDWILNPDDPVRQRMRPREQRINYLNDRTTRASAKLHRDFDRSR